MIQILRERSENLSDVVCLIDTPISIAINSTRVTFAGVQAFIENIFGPG
jgi:hypothetical protein